MNFKRLNRIILTLVLCSVIIFPSSLASKSSITQQLNSQPKAQDDPVLNLVMIWHQHQPSYQDPDTGIYEQPWVFMHGTNSYPYMADVLGDYPDVNVTINLTPSLLHQMMDYVNGTAYDRRLELAYMDESAMSDENKSVVLQYFFDINSQFRQNGTRYAELSEKRNSFNTLQEAVEGFTNQDILDLKTLFFAHWINPRYTSQSQNYAIWMVLSNDIAGHHYNAGEKNAVLNYGYEIISHVVPYHTAAQDRGQLEIITTPFYHPILPLLINLTNAREVNEGTADLPLPTQNTNWTEDAQAQIEKGYNYTSQLFGKNPVGMWPSEEAVCDDIIPLVNQTGLQWFVTDYTVLENSLGVSNLTPEQWFQPYRVSKNGKTSVVFFRHQDLSDQVGFNYGGLNPDDAVADMMDRLNKTRIGWTGDEDPVLTVALDGENAWENYAYDIDDDGVIDYTGNLFREKMYAALEQAQTDGWLRTITPKQYLAEHPAETLNEIPLHTGSWAGDLNVWIGEPDENQAWDRLINARNDLTDFMTANGKTQSELPEAWEALYAAEGSDWFWWYGADKDSGHDDLFDWAFKSNLRSVYHAINWTDEEIMTTYPELFLKELPPVPCSMSGKYLPTIDGQETSAEEWAKAGVYHHSLANSSTAFFKDMYLEVDDNLNALHFRFDTTDLNDLSTITDRSIQLYFSNPKAENTTLFIKNSEQGNMDAIIGFELATQISIDLDDNSISVYIVDENSDWLLINDASITLAIQEVIEISIPLDVLGVIKGDHIVMRALASNDASNATIDITPQDGPWNIGIPFGGVEMNEVFSMDDPAYDEHGIYPTNPQMHPDGDTSKTGLMDILRFRVGYKDDTVYFEFKFRALYNPWNGPGGYSHPLMQVYIDQDNIPNSGRTTCDQNGHFNIEDDHAWEYLVRADGWVQYILQPDDTQLGGVETFCDSVDKVIVFSAPISVLGTPTNDWSYTVAVGSQDFQAFREFYAEAQEWKFGGGDDDAYDPNTVDCLVPQGVDQETILSDYSVMDEQYCTIPAVGPQINFQADTIAPNISITSPTDNPYNVSLAKSVTNTTILLAWNASDNDELDHYEVYDGNVLMETITNASIMTTTIELGEGTHIIKVNAYDVSGNFAQATITINISGPSTSIPGYSIIAILGIASLTLVAFKQHYKKKIE